MDAISNSLDLFARGFGMTVFLSAVAGVGAFILGVILAAMRVSPSAPLRWFAGGYVNVVRNTPLTIMFVVFSANIAFLVGLTIPFTTAALLALTFYTATFVCEAIRSGINSIPVGQAEAARSIGFTFSQTLLNIVLPQALRTAIPPLINVFVALVKNTSVASGFAIFELTALSKRLPTQYPADTMTIFIAIALMYLVITIPLGRVASIVERKVAIAR